MKEELLNSLDRADQVFHGGESFFLRFQGENQIQV